MILLVLLVTVVYIIMGQGVFSLYRRARSDVKDQYLMCLCIWPMMLIILCFMDSALEW